MTAVSADRTPFVGRERELAALTERLAAARRGAGGVVLVAGEPGIGKTRLVAELAERARADGWTVLVGRAVQAEGTPPYLPFVEAVSAHARTVPPEVLRRQLGEGAPDVALLVREVRTSALGGPDLPAPPAPDRYRLFESITELLLAIARGDGSWVLGDGEGSVSPQHPTPNTHPPSTRGLLLVLDDLHWADAPSLQLLLHLARRLRAEPLLVVGTYRDAETGRGHPLAALYADLVREQVADQLVLTGLTEGDVASFITVSAPGLPGSLDLAAAVFRQTEGNPLFVVELVRLLAAEGRLTRPDALSFGRLAIPQSVQHVIGRRLDRLSAGCNHALTLAAVIGREFDLLVLERAAAGTPGSRQAGTARDRERMARGMPGQAGEALLDALEEAEAARVIASVPEAPGRYSFTHPLIRETLYMQILSSRRVRLHRQVGEALEALHAADSEPHLTELAHHFFQAAPAGGAAKAVTYARRAADRALALFAYEDAVELYQTALRALVLHDPGDASESGEATGVPQVEAQRCALLLALGEAQTRAGDTATAKETFLRTSALARRLGLAEQLARAALGYGGYRFTPGVVDAVLVGLLEEALARLPDQPPAPTPALPVGRPGKPWALRARVLARLAMELYHGDTRDRRDALSRAAVETARDCGDPAAMAAALVGRHYAVHEPENLNERLAAAAELVRLAEAGGDREVTLQGYYLLAIDLLELPDPEGVDAAIAAHGRLSQEIRQPLYLWRTDLLHAMRAIQQGRFAEGERLARRAFDLGQRAQIANALPAFGTQMLVLALEAGGLEGLEEQYRQLTDRFPLVPAYRTGLALLYARLGRAEEARVEFERLAHGMPGQAAHGFRDLPRDENWVTSMLALAETCAFLEDTDRAAALYELLAPFAQRNNAVNAAIGTLGAVARYLGLLASTLGRWVEAERHFDAALALNERMGARPAVARTRRDLAAMRLRPGAPAGPRPAAPRAPAAPAPPRCCAGAPRRTAAGRRSSPARPWPPRARWAWCTWPKRPATSLTG